MNDTQKLAQANERLAKIRAQMESFGPAGVERPSDFGAPGELGAENESNVFDAFNAYVESILEALLNAYEISEDDALSFIFDAADEAEADGLLPAMPDDNATEQAVAEWLGFAGTVGFVGYVLGKARENEV